MWASEVHEAVQARQKAAERTYSAPPAFLAGIPDRLLVRRRNAGQDLRRATDLVRYCEERHERPSFLDLERERARR